MKYATNHFVVLLDANVLFSLRKRQILLQFSHANLFQARWTNRILDEWTHNLLKRKPYLEEKVRSQQSEMQESFPDALVTGFEPLIEALSLPDSNDRHVLAAAIRCGAQCIVTDNLDDFPADVLAQYDIEAINADEFLLRTYDLYPPEARVALRMVRERYRKPPYSASEFIMDLIKKGLPKLATRARQDLTSG